MTIISASLNDNILKEMDKLEKELGYTGRSEIIRAGVRLLIADKKEKAKLTGDIDAVLLIIHDEKHTQEVSQIRHNFQALVKTQIHNHLKNHKCLEILVLGGNGQRIKQMLEAFQTNKRIELAKLLIT